MIDFMKNILFTKTVATVVSVALLSASCSTTEKFCIYGKPGTEIYYPEVSKAAGTIPSAGKLQLEVPSDDFYGIMLARYPGREYKVPFGLNFKGASHTGAKIGVGLGYTLEGAGMVSMFTGLIVLIAGSAGDDVAVMGGLLTAGGAAVTGVGAAIGIPSDSRLDQLSFRYNYTYSKSQFAADDVAQVPLLNRDPEKYMSEATKKPSRRKATSGGESVPVAVKTSKSKRSLNDHGKSVAGEYSGKGVLKLGGTTEESYPEIMVLVERVDKSTVSVRVIENGEDFFEAPMIYNVKRRKDGSYNLTMRDVPAATIVVNKNGTMTFIHKSVNIDGDIYTLHITGKR